jgi:hypothetical protein
MTMTRAHNTSSITIRPAYADDDVAVRRLAILDSAEVPAAPLLLAEVDGELRAAVSLDDGAVIADPFAPSVELIALLRVRAAQRAARRRTLRFRVAPAGRLRPLRSRA